MTVFFVACPWCGLSAEESEDGTQAKIQHAERLTHIGMMVLAQELDDHIFVTPEGNVVTSRRANRYAP